MDVHQVDAESCLVVATTNFDAAKNICDDSGFCFVSNEMDCLVVASVDIHPPTSTKTCHDAHLKVSAVHCEDNCERCRLGCEGIRCGGVETIVVLHGVFCW